MDQIKNRMAELTQFPKTNKELADLKKGPIVRFPANEEEYWALAEESELRLDFYNNEIIASMSYESDVHSDIVNNLMFELKTIYRNKNFRFGNSNRPVCIPDCDNAIFNPDGSVIQLPSEQYEYRPGMTAELTPVIVFEVLSKSTRIRDWGEKLLCYKRINTIQHILYVDTKQIRITHLKKLEDGKWLESTYEQKKDQFQLDEGVLVVKDLYQGTLIQSE
jgi:Uma2 family endonuclease